VGPEQCGGTQHNVKSQTNKRSKHNPSPTQPPSLTTPPRPRPQRPQPTKQPPTPTTTPPHHTTHRPPAQPHPQADRQRSTPTSRPGLPLLAYHDTSSSGLLRCAPQIDLLFSCRACASEIARRCWRFGFGGLREDRWTACEGVFGRVLARSRNLLQNGVIRGVGADLGVGVAQAAGASRKLRAGTRGGRFSGGFQDADRVTGADAWVRNVRVVTPDRGRRRGCAKGGFGRRADPGAGRLGHPRQVWPSGIGG
jgi:hypothetical protein